MTGTRHPRFGPAHTRRPVPALHIYPDPWRPLCERCPLPDCVRQEGEYGTQSGINGSGNALDRLAACPIFVAQRRGLTPAEALADSRLGLLEVEG